MSESLPGVSCLPFSVTPAVIGSREDDEQDDQLPKLWYDAIASSSPGRKRSPPQSPTPISGVIENEKRELRHTGTDLNPKSPDRKTHRPVCNSTYPCRFYRMRSTPFTWLNSGHRPMTAPYSLGVLCLVGLGSLKQGLQIWALSKSFVIRLRLGAPGIISLAHALWRIRDEATG